MQQSLSIVMPAMNEEKRIGETLDSYGRYFSTIQQEQSLPCEIFVVINNTTDGTRAIVEEKQLEYPFIRYIDIPARGKGNAVTQGLRDALAKGFTYIGFVDADNATPPEAMWDLVRRLPNTDGAIASRYVAGAVVSPKPTFQRIIASRIFNFLIRGLLFMPYRDTQCGAKAFRAAALRKALPLSTYSRWAFDVELIYNLRRLGCAVVEVPTIWADREYSKINFLTAGPKMALGIVRLRLTHSPLKGLVRLYDYVIRMQH